MSLELVSENRSFGGSQKVFRHPSNTCGCTMTFAAYLPPKAAEEPVPVSALRAEDPGVTARLKTLEKQGLIRLETLERHRDPGCPTRGHVDRPG